MNYDDKNHSEMLVAEVKDSVYQHLNMAKEDIKNGRVQDIDKVCDEIIEELDSLE